MNLIISIIWLAGGTVWTIGIFKNPADVWCWVMMIISFAACIYYAKQFDKQLRE